MERKKWKSKIKRACKTAGTYRPFFESIIDTLAAIMETRDNVREKYESEGAVPVVRHTNKGGATNLVKNPALVILMECDAQALAYWRDLGLTPAGYKKLNAEIVKDTGAGGFERILEKMLE